MAMIPFTIRITVSITLSLTQGPDPAFETSLIAWGTLPLWLYIENPSSTEDNCSHPLLSGSRSYSYQLLFLSLSLCMQCSINPTYSSHQMLRSLMNFYESEVKSISHSVMSDSLRPRGLQPTRFLSPWDSPGNPPIPNVGLPFLPPGDLPNPGIEPGSPALQADSLPTELSGKPERMF